MKLRENPTPYMGEVRAKVKLTNTADAAAAAEGRLPLDAVRSVEAEALVDTGAIRSCVPASLLEKLGVKPVEKVVVEYADGRKEPVDLMEAIRFEIMDRRSSDDAFALGNEILIGQTLLEKMDLLVDCARQKLIPNPAHPDFAVTKVK